MKPPLGISHVAIVTADLGRFRHFYEHTIGLETVIVFGRGPNHARQAIVIVGDGMLHVFEVPGYQPAPAGSTPTMFGRGRLDHVGFAVADEPSLHHLRDRLVEVDASTGEVHRLGPMLSVRFTDPDGCDGEVNCINRAYDPATVRDEDEVIATDWFERTRCALRANR